MTEKCQNSSKKLYSPEKVWQYKRALLQEGSIIQSFERLATLAGRGTIRGDPLPEYSLDVKKFKMDYSSLFLDLMSKRVHSVHAVPSKSGLPWAVKVAGNPTPVSKHHTQKAAIAAGKPIAVKNKTELVIHGVNRKIRDTDSYGNESKTKDAKH